MIASPPAVRYSSVRRLECEHFGESCSFLVASAGLDDASTEWDDEFRHDRCPDCGGELVGLSIARE